MTEKQRQTQVNNYFMLKGLYSQFGDDPDWIHVKRNQNTVADQIINWGTKTGDFNNGCYSLRALQNIYDNKTLGTDHKNENDHTVKTKSLAIKVWENVENFDGPEDYISFLLKEIKILTITRSENKHKGSTFIESPTERYKSLGIDFVYKRLRKNNWRSIHSFDDMLKNFEKITLEEWLNEVV